MKSHRPHIAVLCTTHALGGMELNLLRLAGWLKQRGWKTSALGRENAPFITHANDYGLEAVSVKPYRKYFDVVGAKSLADSLKQHGIDVVFLSANRDVNAAILAKHFFYPSLKVVYLQQMQLGIAKKDMAHTWQYRRLDAWIAPLEWLAEQARANTRIQHTKIHVIPLGIETETFAGVQARKMAAREVLALPREAFLAGVVGRFDEGKYQEVLIRAAGRNAAAGTPFEILLVGEDTRDEKQKYGRRLLQIATELGIERCVHVRPFRNDVETAYGAMDVFAMTTPAETYGMVTVEAMASGLPVVAADGGGSPELLDFGKAGILVPPRDDEALAHAIAALQEDAEWRTALAETGRQRAVSRYTHTAQCAQTEALIQSLFA